MTADTALDWLNATDFAPTPTPADLQEFFGIPPSPPDELAGNIRQKRKYWKKKQSKARSDDALRFAEAVLQAIADAEDALIRGSAATGGGDAEFQPGVGDRDPVTIDDVWRELERLLFRGRYQDALDRVRRYEDHWGQYPNFIDMRSMVILDAVQNLPGITLDPGILQSAVDGSRWAIDKMGPTEARYLTLIDLLEAGGRSGEIPAVLAAASRRLPQMSASFRVRALTVRFAEEAWLPLLRHCVDLVGQAGDDRALRSELVQMIIGRAAAELLPLDSADAVQRYQVIVASAAWIADGVPEAEDFVRLHRMWASNADQLVFGGNWQWRAFFGLITLFLALPLINGSMSKPAWQILLDGPVLGETGKRKAAVASRNRAWFLVTRNLYIEPVHEKARLPWQQQVGHWPEIDAAKLFNF
jgi:hypothetical protein